MNDDKLENLREKINETDNKILDLLDVRSKIVYQIGKLKKKSEGIIDLDREQAVISRIVNSYKGKFSKDTIVRIWRELFEASTKLQTDLKSKIYTKRSIDSIKIYQGGQSNISKSEKKEGFKNIIKLSSNENAFGPSKKISFSNLSHSLNRYPEINGITLRTKISEVHNLKRDQIILGCGSDETLLFPALAFCKSGDEIIHAEHGFEMYSIIAKVVGAVSKPAKELDYKLDIKSILNEINPATKIIYLANPNNPTGSYLTKNEIRKLMLKIPKNIIVVLDGAYAEYVMMENYDLDFSLVDEFENIIMTRTFSKAYGLAGIRLGWCYSSKRVASILNKVKGPFNTNSLAHFAALIALEDQAHINMVIKENKKNKEWFELELKRLGIKFLPSFANFSIIVSTDSIANNIAENLLKNGIIIRKLNSYNLPHCLRVTIGPIEDMKKIINILEKI